MQNQNEICKDAAELTQEGLNLDHSIMITEAVTPPRNGEGGKPERSGSSLSFAKVEPWPEPVNGEALLDELEQVMRRFVILPRYGAEALALWTLHTYAFQLREVSTYLGIESPEKRCGKTTL